MEILVEQATFQARKTEKLDEVMKLIISRFLIIEDNTDMPSLSKMTSSRHINSSSSQTQFWSTIPLGSKTVRSMKTEWSDVTYSVLELEN